MRANHRRIGWGEIAPALICWAGLALAASVRAETAPAALDRDAHLREWAVSPGFALELDAGPFSFPTAIAVVPEPGEEPDAPLYFVTELRGTVKVVTRDRRIHVFAADFFDLETGKELPNMRGESGLAGVCLAPEAGFVFVTFAYQDEAGVLRNNMVRFASQPGRFSLEPTARVAFHEIFAGTISARSHQIGPCQVQGETVYVSVADGWKSASAQDPDTPLGKILRLDLNGRPAPGNPFAADQPAPRDYVFALGLRNPFGLELVGDRVFVAENGLSVDRFHEVAAGDNALWDGSDWSLTSRASFVFAPAHSPVQMEYLPEGRRLFPPEHEGRFYVALAGPPDLKGPRRRVTEGVLALDYDLDARRMRSVPEYIVKYVGTGLQIVAGVAFGRDGMYFSPLFSPDGPQSYVYRLWHEPEREHAQVIGRYSSPEMLLSEKGCYDCHELDGHGRTTGPPLDVEVLVPRLMKRLFSDEYAAQIAALDRSEEEPFRELRGARAAVLEAEGLERLRLWIRYQIKNPKFDDPAAQMPALSVSRAEATRLADHLLADAEAHLPSNRPWSERLWRRLPKSARRHWSLPLAVGGLTGIVVTSLFASLRRRRALR